MFFASLDQVQRNQQSNFVSFYTKLPFIFKSLFLISLLFLIHNLITLNGLFFANIPSITFTHYQYWRIFTAPFATLDGLYGIISLIIGFWWLCSLIPGYQKKYSSVHLIIQLFFQNLLVQLIYSLVVSILVRNTYFYQTYNDFFFSIGWIPLTIIWIFIFTGQNKEQKVNFWFIPLLIKNKYLAWIISCCIILLTIQKTPLIIALLLGSIQFHLFQRSIIRIPMYIHLIIQKPFLFIAKYCASFITISQCKDNLEKLLKGKNGKQSVDQLSFSIEEINNKYNKKYKKNLSQTHNQINTNQNTTANNAHITQNNKQYHIVQQNIINDNIN